MPHWVPFVQLLLGQLLMWIMWSSTMTPYWEVYLTHKVGEQGHPFSTCTLTFQARNALFLIPCSPYRLMLSCKFPTILCPFTLAKTHGKLIRLSLKYCFGSCFSHIAATQLPNLAHDQNQDHVLPVICTHIISTAVCCVDCVDCVDCVALKLKMGSSSGIFEGKGFIVVGYPNNHWPS